MLAWIVDQWTLLTVAALALLFYGSRLPEVARSLGRSVNEFKKGLRDIQNGVGREEPDEEQSRPPHKLRSPAENLAGKPAEEQTKEPVARGGEKQDEEAG